jgi:hypothetical protein
LPPSNAVANHYTSNRSPNLIEKRKRSPWDSGDQELKRINELAQIPSISPPSIQQKDITDQLNDKVIYNRPFPTREAIPIALLHSAFAKFLRDCLNHTPTQKDNEWAEDLRYKMLQHYEREFHRCEDFRKIFETHTGKRLKAGLIPGGKGYVTDGHLITGNNFLLVTEGKNELKNMSTDPKLQSFAYYIQIVKARAKEAQDTEKKSLMGRMPCFLVYYFGDYISDTT